MNTEKNYLNDVTNKIFFMFFPVSVFFYIILTHSFPRNSYRVLRTKILEKISHIIARKSETKKKIKLRKKLLKDLKIHSTSINFNKKSVTKVIVNSEGKILGYKFCNLFYPNYFTKTQNYNVIVDSELFEKKPKLFLIIFKYN